MKPPIAYLISIILLHMVAHVAVAQATNTQDSTPADATTNQWVQRGNPLVEYPLCYQLWQCRSQLAEKNKEKNIPVLPVGTWGLCENYLTPQKGAPVCNRCDALMPDIPCF